MQQQNEQIQQTNSQINKSNKQISTPDSCWWKSQHFLTVNITITKYHHHQMLSSPNIITTKYYRHQILSPPNIIITKYYHHQILSSPNIIITKYHHHQMTKYQNNYQIFTKIIANCRRWWRSQPSPMVDSNLATNFSLPMGSNLPPSLIKRWLSWWSWWWWSLWWWSW